LGIAAFVQTTPEMTDKGGHVSVTPFLILEDPRQAGEMVLFQHIEDDGVHVLGRVMNAENICNAIDRVMNRRVVIGHRIYEDGQTDF